MSSALRTTKTTVRESAGILGFEPPAARQTGRLAEERYLTIEGRRAYDLGNLCGTCAYLFERLPGANQKVSPTELSAELRQGLVDIPPDLLDAVLKLAPVGDYRVSLLQIRPRRVTLGAQDDYFTNEQVALWGIDSFWGLPHYPKIQYYRSLPIVFDGDSALFEFFVPIYPQSWLNEAGTADYRELIGTGKRPTAVALSVLDVRQPFNWGGSPAITKHWCLAHYLIDGHHKTFVAADLDRPITLLALLAVNECLASDEHIDQLFRLL
jgi:hypothetical protein